MGIHLLLLSVFGGKETLLGTNGWDGERSSVWVKLVCKSSIRIRFRGDSGEDMGGDIFSKTKRSMEVKVRSLGGEKDMFKACFESQMGSAHLLEQGGEV